MHDVTKLSDVRPGIMAKIKNISGDSIEAIIFKIISSQIINQKLNKKKFSINQSKKKKY